jgi:hypothetical protein
MGSRWLAEFTDEESNLASLLAFWVDRGGLRGVGVVWPWASSWVSWEYIDDGRILLHEEKPNTGDDMA